ncbi:MAG: T9SS sorting signal type C domain-containing protein [Flavobacterium sp. JAD_PAG50586_2]|nr:MAG: T9SS sorting signal type C domain-containing protein [Flavobacterium sp. JAD_PAG50586_2]
MKKALLTASSKFSRFYVRTLFVLLLVIGVSASSEAQCGPYQGYESIPNAIPATVVSTMTAAGWQFVGAPTSWVSLNNTTATSRSGRTRLASSFPTTAPTVSPGLITPKINTPQTFSFWIRGNNTAGLNYTVYFSDDNKATWIPIPHGATTLTGGNGSFPVSSAIMPTLPGITSTIPMVLATVTATFPADADGYYFKIEDSRPIAPATNVPGGIQIDDISWISSVSTDNTIIVPNLNDAGVCTITVPATGIYKYYDNGGSSDTYSDGQTNGVIFTPFNPADKVRITFKTFEIISGQENFNVYDSNTIGSGAILGSPFTGGPALPLGSATPINSYTSTFATGEIATQFTSNGTYRTGNSNAAIGYEIEVECISGSCADPGVPTVSGTTFNSANLTWSGAAPVGYEIAYTTTASPPGAAGSFVASPTVTGTLTGLTPNTVYYGWVRAQCGASSFSNWVSTATSFTTLCAPVGVPYTENFNGLNGPLPTCTSQAGGGWGTNLTNGNLFGSSLSSFFFTKPITLAAATVYKLSYDYSTLAFNANFQVWIGTANNASMLGGGTLLFTHPAATNSVTNNTLNFTSGAAGTYYIGFYFVSRTNNFAQLNIDNIFLDVETCIAPSGVVGSAPTASSGTVSWTAPSIIPSGGYQYYISTSNTPPTSASTPSGLVPSGTTTTIGSLTSGTTYYVWVRSSCGGGLTSLWSNSFATISTTVVLTTTVPMSNGNNGPGGSCSVNFFDSGGATLDYQDNETYTYTFYPGTAGSKLKAVFGSFRTENNYDGLMIYSGTSANPANLISSGLPVGVNGATCPAGSFYGTNSPGTVISTDATGALTFVFTTDGSVLFAGWAATLSCVTVPTISSFTPNNNLCGTLGSAPITITGTNFTAAGGVTGVFFNGVAATSFTIVNSTTLTAVLPASGVTSGIISVANATATGYSSTAFSVNGTVPTTTGVTICTGATGNLTTSTTCSGYVNSGTTLSGTLTAGVDPVGPILGTSITNTAVCGFNAGVQRNYVGITFQVSVTGTYTFESSATPAFDSMGYIVRTPFTPGTCSGNWVRGDDDGGAGTFSLLSAVLTAGVDYILYTTSWAGTSGAISGPFSWAVTPPAGGQIMLPGVPVMNWYVNASTTTVLGSGNSFNPVGVSGSGLANTNTATAPGGVIYYGACPSNPTCRTATPFVINARPTVSFTAQPGAIACTSSNVTYTTQAGQTNYVWTIPGILNTDYTIVSGGTTTSNTVTLQWLTAGVKTVTINYSNALGCPATTAVSSTATTVSLSGLSTTVTPSSAAICANVPQALTASSGSANFFTWTTTSGSLFTDAACTVAYVPGTNFATVYFKGTANATVTASGTVGGTGCPADINVAITINKAIWNGSVWSNAGVGPSNTISAEFQGNFTSNVNASATSGNLSACSVVVTSGNVLFDRGTLTVENSVVVSGGTLTFTDTLFDVALLQPNNVANPSGYSGGNTGNITFNRTSAPLFRYDYTYWSAPVYPQNLLAMTPNSPFGLFLDYGTAWNYIPNPGLVTMIPAKGYATRSPLNYNLPSGMPNTPQAYTAPFIGVPNNGDLSIPILGGATAMNLLGNPYPSALSADDFILGNPNVNGTLYFWTHNSQSFSPYQYVQSDYAIYTLAGGTGTIASTTPGGTANTTTPAGFIASGQGFFVKGLTNSTAVFTNDMRVAGSNSQFYKTNQQQLEKNRYWLNMLSVDGAFKQALVGYIETATTEIDRLFDGEVVEAGNAVSLYTKVGDVKLSIQGRPLPFDIADTVPLSYRATTATTFTISIPEADGLFESQHVYLEDLVLNVIHDLTESAYTFATEAGTFEERFVLRYTDQALGNENPVFNENSVVVYHNANGLFINTGNENMAKVTIFDIRGRLLASQNEVNNTFTSFTTLPTTQQVLLVKIEGESGRVVTKKVVY